MTAIPEDQEKNYEIFLDCLSTALIEKISQPQAKPKRRTKPKSKKPTSTPPQTKSANPDPETEADTDLTSADDLADFAGYIATTTFHSLPSDLKTLDYYLWTRSPSLQTTYTLPFTGTSIPPLPTLDPAIADSLSTYSITREPTQGINEFLAPILTHYLSLITKPPPAPRATLKEATGCEICERNYIPLSYHHLIPRFVHSKAVKRGWHKEEDLQNVAWLCGACHRFVHRFAGHEELARRYYTVELLMEDEGVRRWAEWVGRLRWKGR
ncbi:uncharacterized protein F4822DRAFT_412339 [Hypoxylon trugodes]|uniref:uncharacterized protein n=1 Tax=Hypoxylon trugodes TaxID=326681 RepID=UPI0021941417|nr:uncharacterized protein F4822DRAFT_412339 [Hypoxylon trugodes]KAI1385193.1 hypothetical protein F4822DRAFT_412339 [Hypoxylon trugodes]